MNSFKMVCVSTGITVGLGLLLYRYRKRLGSKKNIPPPTAPQQQPPPPPLPPVPQQQPPPVAQQQPPPVPQQQPPPAPQQKPPPVPQQQPPPVPQQQPQPVPQQQPPPPQQKQQLITEPKVANCEKIPNKRIRHDGEKSINEETNVKRPIKRKNKQEMRPLNDRYFHFIYPKSPMMVFSELFNDVKIHLQEHPVDTRHTVMSYTATIEIDNHICTENHISEMEAKQKACESYLRAMLANKLSERSREMSTTSKSKGHPKEDFPWVHFASLAIHFLINKWELQHKFTSANYIDATIKLKENKAKICVSPKSPLMVFNELYKDATIKLQPHQGDASSNTIGYTATIEIDGQMYFENHTTKIQAKQKVCENHLRAILAHKLSKRSAENAARLKSKGHHEEDFPWVYFASLGMHFLMNKWELQYF